MQTLEELVDDFLFLEDWDERYRYLIELGRKLEPLPAEAHSEPNRVKGCASQVWLETSVENGTAGPVLRFRGDSDAHIVRGLIYLAFAVFGNRPAAEIVATDPAPTFRSLGLADHLTPQRSNGLRAMVDRIKADAAAALDADRAIPAPSA